MEVIAQMWSTIQQNYLAMIEIWDIIDIAIVSFLVYQLLRLVRRSRSGQVVKALALLVAALGLASVLHLTVIRFILNRAVELGLIALVIIFQPELRHFLEQMGSGQFKKMLIRDDNKGNELENAIRQTVAAYTALSKDKIGALTVFERNVLLDGPLKTGTILDGTVSSELLKNIFWPKAPMHDGAVIVREGRVAGAGCMLPLSGNVNLSRDLGMRHRAGIGMSENSDAVVAIVSEETGSISVAVQGMLKRHLAPETLERLLRNELLPKEDSTTTKRQKFLKFSDFVKAKKGDKSDGEKNSGQ
ncbi:MAG: hypothetical protein H6Q60_1226 [Oscillospiraceae bacterium]|nr:hypothetical protein [Oscillospiraceae bacterium]